MVLLGCSTAGLLAQWWSRRRRRRGEVTRPRMEEEQDFLEMRAANGQCSGVREGGEGRLRDPISCGEGKELYLSSGCDEGMKELGPNYQELGFRETFIAESSPVVPWGGYAGVRGDRRTLLPPDRGSPHIFPSPRIQLNPGFETMCPW